jgi:hypothetical protein
MANKLLLPTFFPLRFLCFISTKSFTPKMRQSKALGQEEKIKIRPRIGIGTVYLLGFAIAAFRFAYHFFGGALAITSVISLLIFFIYYRWPKFMSINPEGVDFEFYNGKVMQLSFSTIHRINTKGLFKWRVIFKNGGWSDILNYSLLSKKDKQMVYESYIKYYEY